VSRGTVEIRGTYILLSFSGETDGMSSIGRGLWWESNDLRIIYLATDANKQLIIFVTFAKRGKNIQKLKY